MTSALEAISKVSPITEYLIGEKWAKGALPENVLPKLVKTSDGRIWNPAKRWTGQAPVKCEVSGTEITDTFIDGATRLGPWANMHPSTHMRMGIGLGIGKGQKYCKAGELWIKVEPGK